MNLEEKNQPAIRSFWNELYIELMSSPIDQRTDREFCEEVKIHINTLQTWKRNNRVAIYNEVQKRRSQYVNELRAIAYKNLHKLSAKDVSGVKLIFQLCGDLVEQTKTTHEYLSRQDKIDRINNLLTEANAKQKKWTEVQKKAESDGKTDSPEKA